MNRFHLLHLRLRKLTPAADLGLCALPSDVINNYKADPSKNNLVEWETTLQEVAISEFKAKCLALLDQVRKTKKPIRVTRFGKPVADVVPPAPVVGPADWLGSLADTMEILGDIVSPVIG